MRDFSVILILKGIMTLSQRVHAIFRTKLQTLMKTETESKINFNKNEAESKKENPTQSETNVVLQLI